MKIMQFYADYISARLRLGRKGNIAIIFILGIIIGLLWIIATELGESNIRQSLNSK